MLNICIKLRQEGDQLTWEWNAEHPESHLGRALAVLERVIVMAALQPLQRDPFEHEEPDRKMCISYDHETELIEVSVRNLTMTEAIEGLLDARYTMQRQWMGDSQARVEV